MARTTKTNDVILKKYVKELDPLMMVVLRERLLLIAEITLKAIEKDPESFDNPIFHHTFYKEWANQTIKVMGFDD